MPPRRPADVTRRRVCAASSEASPSSPGPPKRRKSAWWRRADFRRLPTMVARPSSIACRPARSPLPRTPRAPCRAPAW